jgi:hypothetical protein
MNIEREIIDTIRALASKNYDKGYGWQIIIECMDDEQILEQAGDTHHIPTAIRNIEHFVEIQSERYDEVNAAGEW